jgi:hypothetical protein
VFLVVFAVTIWFFPAYRVFSGIATIMIALLSLVATNLGGFLVGFLLAMFGGAFAVAWAPRAAYTADTRRQRRAAAQAGTGHQEAETSGIETANTVAAGTASTSTANTSTGAENGETEAPAAEPAEVEDAVAGSAHDRDTRIIEHQARPDEADAAPPEPAPEEE